MTELIIHDGKFCCIDKDILNFPKSDADFVAYDIHVAMDRIQESIVEYYVYNTKPINFIYVNEYTLSIYLGDSCSVINCSNKPPNLEFSNDKYYGTHEEYIQGYRDEPINSGYGLYTISPYFMKST